MPKRSVRTFPFASASDDGDARPRAVEEVNEIEPSRRLQLLTFVITWNRRHGSFQSPHERRRVAAREVVRLPPDSTPRVPKPCWIPTTAARRKIPRTKNAGKPTMSCTPSRPPSIQIPAVTFPRWDGDRETSSHARSRIAAIHCSPHAERPKRHVGRRQNKSWDAPEMPASLWRRMIYRTANIPWSWKTGRFDRRNTHIKGFFNVTIWANATSETSYHLLHRSYRGWYLHRKHDSRAKMHTWSQFIIG